MKLETKAAIALSVLVLLAFSTMYVAKTTVGTQEIQPTDKEIDISHPDTVGLTYDHDAEVVCYYRTESGGLSCLPVNDTAYSPEDFAR